MSLKPTWPKQALAIVLFLTNAPLAFPGTFTPNPMEQHLPPARSREESLWRAFTFCNLSEAKQLLAANVRADAAIHPHEGPALLGLVTGCYDDELLSTLQAMNTNFNSFGQDHDEMTLLRLLVTKPDRDGKLAEMIKTFMGLGANPSYRGDHGGASPVDMAATTTRTSILAVLLNSPLFVPQSVSALGNSPIHSLVIGMCTKPQEALKALEMLKAAGVPTATKNKKGMTAADLVNQFGKISMGAKTPICGVLKGQL